ncbi:MAG TPA: Lrp/AsnC family transcriptional regulator [Candidatus Bilamarchaeaceae archaeon]|nr:Lrp/AsnC family transcriptional regulator [Candidatus Bilamarchaeaceae archaeon]
MGIHAKDRKILYELEYDARKPLNEIAKATRMPKQVVSYRINKMIETSIIRGFRTLIDIHRLGYFSYRIYFRLQDITPENEKILFDKLSRWKNIIWVIATTGRWDLEIVVAARNNINFSNWLLELKKEIGDYIKEYTVSPSIVNYHFKRKYLAEKWEEEKVIPKYGFEPEVEKLDRIDFDILKILATDAIASYTEIGMKIGLTYNGVKKRIKSLEKRGIIQAYRTWLNLDKMERKFYKAMISISKFDEKIEKALLSFCIGEPTVVYLVECSGSWDIEIEAEVKDEFEFRELIVRFRNTFKDIVKDYEILHAYKELKLDYFPFESFEKL